MKVELPQTATAGTHGIIPESASGRLPVMEERVRVRVRVRVRARGLDEIALNHTSMLLTSSKPT